MNDDLSFGEIITAAIPYLISILSRDAAGELIRLLVSTIFVILLILIVLLKNPHFTISSLLSVIKYEIERVDIYSKEIERTRKINMSHKLFKAIMRVTAIITPIGMTISKPTFDL